MLSKQQVLSAFDELISEAERLHSLFLSELRTWTPEFAVWLKACESTIEAVFGSGSHALTSFRWIYFLPPPRPQLANHFDPRNTELTWFNSGLRYAHATLVGYRYSVDRLAPESPERATPFVFISHGGPSLDHVHAVRDFVDAVGLSPVLVREMPNLDLSINEKVRAYMSICTGAIVLATVEDETKANEQRARPNVEHEIGMLQASPNIGSRIIYLKEPGVVFGSNYAEKVWIAFDRTRVQDVFTAIAKELRAYGFLG